MAAPNDIDAYILQFPTDVQKILLTVRETIRNAAPTAKEVISYQMPALRQHGILVYFAAWKNHIGLYPPISGDVAIEKAVAKYAGPRGNLQFPLNEPIPYNLIKRIVRLRVKQDRERAEAKRDKRKKK
ncbi:MAG: iron chaperone [Thermoguttaceae bacterium]